MNLNQWATTQPDRCDTCGYHLTRQTCTCPGSEWSRFVTAVRQVVRADGTVHQNDVRPLIRGRIEPKHVGQMYRRARSEGLLVDTGDREPSNDRQGRNTDKEDRIYKLATASERAA